MGWSVSVSPKPRFWVDFNDTWNEDGGSMLVGFDDAMLVWWPDVYEGARIELSDFESYRVEATVKEFYPNGGPELISDLPYLIAVIDWDTWGNPTPTAYQRPDGTWAQGYGL